MPTINNFIILLETKKEKKIFNIFIFASFQFCFNSFCITFYGTIHSHKKQKDSLEGSLNQVLLAVELEFPKILLPRLPQHTSNVNIECGGRSEWSKQ